MYSGINGITLALDHLLTMLDLQKFRESLIDQSTIVRSAANTSELVASLIMSLSSKGASKASKYRLATNHRRMEELVNLSPLPQSMKCSGTWEMMAEARLILSGYLGIKWRRISVSFLTTAKRCGQHGCFHFHESRSRKFGVELEAEVWRSP